MATVRTVVVHTATTGRVIDAHRGDQTCAFCISDETVETRIVDVMELRRLAGAR